MDERSAREQRPTPDEVRAGLHRWIEENPERAERLGMRWVRRYPNVLEPGDAFSLVYEAVLQVVDLARRRPVLLDGAPGLVAHRLGWVAARRVRALRPGRELPLGLGADGCDPDDLESTPDELGALLSSRPSADLGEELRGAYLLQAAERVALRSRRRLHESLMSGEAGAGGDQLLALRAAAVAGSAAPLGAGAATRQRMRRGRQAVVRWLRAQARSEPEREALDVLIDAEQVEGERGRAAALLEWAGLDEALAAIPAEQLAAMRRPATTRPARLDPVA